MTEAEPPSRSTVWLHAPPEKVTVPTTPDRAFEVFTAEMSVWWPLVTHSIGADTARRVEFGYAVEHADDGRLLATAVTALFALDVAMRPTRLSPAVRQMLRVVPDPLPLQIAGAKRSSAVDA